MDAGTSSRPPIVLGIGVLTQDLIGSVPSFPQPDSKIRTTSLVYSQGGNIGNELTCLARLGIECFVLSKVGKDSFGEGIIQSLATEKINSSYVVAHGNTSFSYIILDTCTKTRTIINTPGDDLALKEINLEILDKVQFIVMDGRHTQASLQIAQITQKQGKQPIFLELERLRPNILQLIPFASYILTSSNFPDEVFQFLSYNVSERGELSEIDIEKGPLHVLMKLCRNSNWIVVTKGSLGSVLIKKTEDDDNDRLPVFSSIEECIEKLSSLQQHQDNEQRLPQVSKAFVKYSLSSEKYEFSVFYCPAYFMKEPEIVDTVGAGDCFLGCCVFSVLSIFTIDKMLRFASFMAAEKCKKMGARDGILHKHNIDFNVF
eukprot:TRINITY_DN1050_c0_g1_i1.p1 TRINITY_DN1050_c0_g1~~TRINITY_DN1050_c0_g1_i1.p1  ORF type:complete len:374 (+),score=68.57 TRINITY_DN1050_c0_g1_i1:143-1264(+)